MRCGNPTLPPQQRLYLLAQTWLRVGYRDDEHLMTSLFQSLCEDRYYSNSTRHREGRKNKRDFHLKVPLKTLTLEDALGADARVGQERGRVNVNYRFPDVYIESTPATV